MKKLTVPMLAMALIVSGCLSTQQGLVPNPTATRAMNSHADDLKLSCSELNLRSGRLEARLAELEQEAKVQRRKDAVTNGLMSIGGSLIPGIAARGGVNGLRTAGAVMQGVDAVSSAEASQAQLSSITDTISIAQRHSDLQRAAIEKGC